ncbi:hypothetical protein GW791_01535 [Candidatus Saccharibacteria bacterium]|nr:hypothetical protein [Candidatus Saccharibacteria bacterium]
MMNELHKKAVNRVKSDNERGARHALLEELFYDFQRSRAQVYGMNFMRGVFFGFGSVLGATVVVAFIIWLLSLFTGLFPEYIGHYIQQIIDAMQHTKQ